MSPQVRELHGGPSPGRPRRARFRPGVTRGGDAAGTSPAAVTGLPAEPTAPGGRRLFSAFSSPAVLLRPAAGNAPGSPHSSRSGSPIRFAPPAEGELAEPRAAQTQRQPPTVHGCEPGEAGGEGRYVVPGRAAC